MTPLPLTSTHGWVALDEKAIGKLEWQELPLRPTGDSDVDIEVTHCAICGTDTHAIQNSWVSYVRRAL